jgi:hypothetical protein
MASLVVATMETVKSVEIMMEGKIAIRVVAIIIIVWVIGIFIDGVPCTTRKRQRG